MEENVENVVEETTNTNEPKGMETKGDVTKVVEKMKMKPMVEKQTITKLDLNKSLKTEEDTNKEQEVVEEISPEQNAVQNEDTPVIEEVVKEEEEEEEIPQVPVETITKTQEPKQELPENIEKLVSFMNDTGGDLKDYVKLNQDYSELDNLSLLEEFYNQTKPHLNKEEIDFLMKDKFSFDEDADSEKDIKRKKLALKEQVADAKSHLDGQKSRYYQDIKSGSKLTSEQQKAIDFFDRYNEESKKNQEVVKQNTDIFTQKTNQVFNDKFKGFEYNVGDKKYRFNVGNVEEIKNTQSDISNFTKKFLDENSTLSDAKGYHKSLYTAMNADAIANHFYEQGKTDAMKTSIAESKNVDMKPRQSHDTVEVGGMKFKVLGDNSADFKLKIKNK